MKKPIILLFILTICISLFCGCNSSAKPKSLEKNMIIPDNGIIEASVFEKLKLDNKIITFLGKDKQYEYYWTVYGSNINTAKDCNLKLKITSENDYSLEFKTFAENDFDFSPNLSICLKGKKNVSKAKLIKDNKTLSEVFVSFKNDNTIFNFNLTDTGIYSIKFELPRNKNNSKKQTVNKKSSGTTEAKSDTEIEDREQSKSSLDYADNNSEENTSKSVNTSKNNLKSNKSSVSSSKIAGENRDDSVTNDQTNGSVKNKSFLKSSNKADEKSDTATKSKNSTYKKSVANSGTKTEATGKAKDNSNTGNKNADINSSKVSNGENASSGTTVETEQPKDNQSEQTSVDAPPESENICYFSINCSTIFNNLSELNPDKFDVLPADGWILERTDVTFVDGESVYDILTRICSDYGLHIDSEFTPLYGSYYVKAIGNLYEFDCGEGSGWMFCVDGKFPNYGCSECIIKKGQDIEFKYTCDFGADVGNEFS